MHAHGSLADCSLMVGVVQVDLSEPGGHAPTAGADRPCWLTGKLVIPKGWMVLPYFRSVHYDPTFYPDPYKFNPWRYKVLLNF